MNRKHIQDLLNKYFEGETSLGEEKELKEFFRKTKLLPEEWKSYKQLFALFESEGKKTMPLKADIQKKKNAIWIAVIGISLAATVLILLTIFMPPTKNQLEPLAIATKHLDTFATRKNQIRKNESTKPVKSESKKSDRTRSVPIRKLLDDDESILMLSLIHI